MNRFCLYAAGLGLVICLAACSSRGPKTEYYSLFASDEAQARYGINDSAFTIGIGPIRLPEYLDTPALVSLDGRQRLSISGRHAWAGDLAQSMSRVLADELASQWQLDGVWAFPWDNRIRPHYQINIVVERFIGQRGGEVVLQVSWTLQNKNGKIRHLLHRELFSETTASAGYEDYVAAQNQLLMALAGQIAQKTHAYWLSTLAVSP